MSEKLQLSFNFKRNIDKASKQLSYVNGNWNNSASLKDKNVELTKLEGRIRMGNTDKRVNISYGKNKRHLYVATGGSSSTTLKYSLDGINWIDSDGYFDNLGYGVAFDGKMWVAVGKDSSSSNSILYSDDGRKWYPVTSGTFSDFGLGVAWNDGLWVATGKNNPTDSNTIKYSTDGKTWTNATSGGFDTYGYRVRYGGDKWVAVGSDTGGYNIAYSVDGKVWSSGSNPFSTDGRDVAWNGEKWVAVGAGTNPVKYSSDGIAWTNASVSISYGNAVAWNGEIWLIGGYSPSMMYSHDGITWITSGFTNTFSSNTNSITWTGERWLAGGTGSGKTIKYSLDGFNWFDIASGEFVSYCLSVFYTSLAENTFAIRQTWVAAGYTKIKYSHDGFTWYNANNHFSSSGECVKWNGEIWLAGGSDTNSRIKYSYDGINWSNITSGDFTSTCYGIEWNGSMWVAVGTGGATIKYSTDGLSWSNATGSTFDYGGHDVAWNGSLWIACGDTTGSKIRYSSNGTSWSSGGTVNLSIGYAIAWGNDKWVVGGEPGIGGASIYYSTDDGANWTGASGTYSNECWDITWNGHLFVAGGEENKTLKYSFDGETWTDSTDSSSNYYIYSIAWDGEKWIAVGEDNERYSYDGINWTGVDIGIFLCRGVASSNDNYGYHIVSRDLSSSIKLSPEDTVWVCSDAYYDHENIDTSITLSE